MDGSLCNFQDTTDRVAVDYKQQSNITFFNTPSSSIVKKDLYFITPLKLPGNDQGRSYKLVNQTVVELMVDENGWLFEKAKKISKHHVAGTSVPSSDGCNKIYEVVVKEKETDWDAYFNAVSYTFHSFKYYWNEDCAKQYIETTKKEDIFGTYYKVYESYEENDVCFLLRPLEKRLSEQDRRQLRDEFETWKSVKSELSLFNKM